MFFVLFCFFVFCVFYFIKISKFALPGVMLIYERTSKDRKKERKKEEEPPQVLAFQKKAGGRLVQRVKQVIRTRELDY